MSPATQKGSLVDRLWRAQDGCCFHCGRRMLCALASNHGRRWSRDHLWPQSRYGRGRIVLACRACNSRRGDREPTVGELDRAAAVYAAMGEDLAPPSSAASPPPATLGDIWPATATA